MTYNVFGGTLNLAQPTSEVMSRPSQSRDAEYAGRCTGAHLCSSGLDPQEVDDKPLKRSCCVYLRIENKYAELRVFFT